MQRSADERQVGFHAARACQQWGRRPPPPTFQEPGRTGGPSQHPPPATIHALSPRALPGLLPAASLTLPHRRAGNDQNSLHGAQDTKEPSPGRRQAGEGQQALMWLSCPMSPCLRVAWGVVTKSAGKTTSRGLRHPSPCSHPSPHTPVSFPSPFLGLSAWILTPHPPPDSHLPSHASTCPPLLIHLPSSRFLLE